MWNWLIDILQYNPEQPLIFSRFFFWGFFLVVLGLYTLVYPHRLLRNSYLFCVSLFFYYKSSGLSILILIFSTVSDFFIGKKIYEAKHPTVKKMWVGLSVFLNISVLAYFKYAYFFTDNFNAIFNTKYEVINHFAQFSNSFFNTSFRVDKILLPVGISFYTFQTISYSVDIYRGQVRPVKNILDFGFYVSFFPQLVAGPIVRASEFIPQLYKSYSVTREEFGLGIFWIINGLIKKIVFADYIAVNFIDRVFADPERWGGFENLMALYGYTLQVYADFSGYTDIAIGVALLMGFYLPQNFWSPYKSQNVGEFWKRWHMSLSSWLKDYLYIPMGGNRSGSFFSYFSMFCILVFISFLAKSFFVFAGFAAIAVAVWILGRLFPSFKKEVDTNINLMMTMLIGGLWHGASWNFVTWGGLNGLGLVIFKQWKKFRPWKNPNHPLVKFSGILITFNFITFTRTWFRGEDWEKSLAMLSQIANHFDWSVAPEVVSSFSNVFWLMSIGFLLHWLPENWKISYRKWFCQAPRPVQLSGFIIAVFVVYQSVSAELTPFIYFAF